MIWKILLIWMVIQIPLGVLVGKFIAAGMGDGDRRQKKAKTKTLAWRCYP